MTIPMRAAATLYDAAAGVTVDRVCVDGAKLRTFSLGVQNFIRRLADDAGDSYWKPVLARLRRVRWELATVPLPAGDAAFSLRDSALFVSQRLRGCESVFPAHAGQALELAATLADLAESDADPLGEAVRMLCEKPGSRVLILRDGRHAAAVEQRFARSLAVTVAVPSEVDASARVYDRAIAVGPSAWFPGSIFAAPKAREIHVVQFDWLRDPPLDVRLFPAPEGGDASGSLELAEYVGPRWGAATMEPVELLPITDWAAIAAGTGARGDQESARADTVDAYLFLLASEQAIYLEAEEGSRAYIVELSEGKELHLVPTRSIQPGAYIVTRVGGEGDYIPAIADSLLGAEAERLRQAQQRWTQRLEELVISLGIRTVAARVEAAGSPRASSYGNVRRWASAKSIRTEDYEDFAAVMRVIGLESEAETIWQDMDLIDQAHRRAGQRVRVLLNRELRTADTRDLERRGWQDYDVEEIEGEGALRVARVEARAPGKVPISARQTRQLVSVERDLWQG